MASIFSKFSKEKPSREEQFSIQKFQLNLAKARKDGVVFRDREQQRDFLQRKDKFQKAKVIVGVCGSWGLGDAIMEARYMLALAKKTGRAVLCQVPPPLVEALRPASKDTPNFGVVGAITGQIIDDPSVFYISLNGTFPRDIESWIENCPSDLDDPTHLAFLEKCEEISFDHRSLSLSDIYDAQTNARDSLPELEKRYRLTIAENNCLADQHFSLLLATLGIDFSVKEISNSSLTPFSSEELANIPQDYDYIIAVDAKEFEEMDGRVKRSSKSLPVSTWEEIFSRFPPGTKISFVMGNSHSAYCKEVLRRARLVNSSLHIDVFQGSLLELARHILRGKRFIGMDSGTTHLAVDVIRAAKEDRKIELRQVFNSAIVKASHYAATEGEVFVAAGTSSIFRVPTKENTEKLASFLTK